ncbi:hypothetical protein DNK57_03550 [Methanothermobacter thermautotrophicus]|uniref:Uncharacterized protein n=1 Tax=Methanothermobacter thermautotrophicus TaxID=145262 RepID=A0A842YKM1_METTF|nr:hypothetical protein [Methanothermobacter thermautotrophicus]MBE2899896.1 hypothetical protein [Methanothermobacter thermautotrophicus]
MELKEIKSVRVVPYTIMNSSIGAIWAFIFALLILIFAGAISSALPAELRAFGGLITGISVVGLVVLPVGTFLLSIVESFLRAYIYNGLTPRLGGIKLALTGMEKVESFDIVSTSLILSAVAAILNFIYQLLAAPLQWVFFSTITSIAKTVEPSAVSSMAAVGSATALGTIINIVLTPVMTFVVSFIVIAIGLLLYNFLSARITPIKLKLSETVDGLVSIDGIEAIPLGLITGSIAALLGLIVGIIALIILSIAGEYTAGILILVALTVGAFICTFIVYGLTALFYNVLAPRIGAVQIKLE